MKNKKLIFSLIIVCICFILFACDNATTKAKTSATHVHEFEWAVVKEATCTEDGEKKGTCSCGETQTEVIKATGHTYGEWATVTPATCLVDGSEKRTCACGASETREVKASGHTYGEWAVVTAASCIQKGEEKRTCSCGAFETREIALAEHDYGDLIDEVPATCMENGVEAHYECSVCEKVFTPAKKETTLEALATEKTGHKIVKYSVTLVTDVTTLASGDKIVLVSGTNGCGADSNAFTVEYKDELLLPNYQFEVLTLKKGSIDGTWALQFKTNSYIGAYSQDSFNLGTGNSSISEKTSYLITIDENGVASFVSQGNETDTPAKYIVYNSETNSFARLTEGTSNIKIYKYQLNDFNPSVPVTCEEDGNKAYYECEYCDYIEDESGKEMEDATIAKIGHKLTSSWEWAVDHSYARITIKCENENNATLVDRVKVRAEKTSTASCTTAGKITYTVVYEFDHQQFTTSYEEDVEAGHSYFLRIPDTYVVATSYEADTQYYTFDSEDEVYVACEKITGFEEEVTYYTLVKAHNEYSVIDGTNTIYGCKLEYDQNNSKYVFKYTCLICDQVETKDAVVKSVSEAKALTTEYKDLFLVHGLVVGPVHNGNRACLLIQDATTGEVYEVSGFANGVIYNSETKEFVETFKAGDVVSIPVQVKQYVCDGEADNGKMSLEAMLSTSNYEAANCVESSGTTLKALKDYSSITTITSQAEFEAFLFNEDKTYKTENVYKVIKLSGIISIFKGSNGYDIGMGSDFSKSSETKINSKTIRVRVGNTLNILGYEMDKVVFGDTLANGKALFTGDLYLEYFGGTTGYLQFVIISAEDAVVRQIEKESSKWVYSWTNPTVTTYKVGNDYSLNGAACVIDKYVANSVKDFVTTETIEVTSANVVTEGTTYDKTTAGKYVVKVEVSGQTHEYNVEVKDKELVSIDAPTTEKVTVYYTELALDKLILSSYDITLNYDNDSTDTVDLTSDMLSIKGEATLADGDITFVIEYQGKSVEWTVTLACDYYYVLYDVNNADNTVSAPVAGNVIIIVARAENKAVGGNDYKQAVDVTISNNQITYDNTYAEFKLVNGYSTAPEGSFALMNESGKYLVSSSSSQDTFGYQDSLSYNTSYSLGTHTYKEKTYSTLSVLRSDKVTSTNKEPSSYLAYGKKDTELEFCRTYTAGNSKTSYMCLRIFVKYSHTTGEAVNVNNN